MGLSKGKQGTFGQSIVAVVLLSLPLELSARQSSHSDTADHGTSLLSSVAAPIPATGSVQDKRFWLALTAVLAATLLYAVWMLFWNRSLRLQVQHHSDELKQELAERQKVEIALKAVRDELEERVRSRTNDLELKNLQLNETRIALENANEKLQDLASVDGLTGISNRRHFDETLEREIRRSVRASKPLTLIMTDIDFFKPYNDEYGHVAGDDTLRAIAAVFRRTFRRAGDLPARYGGEEFAIILYGVDTREALKYALRLQDSIRSLGIPHAGSPIADHVTVSTGITTFQGTEIYLPETLIETADRALYLAKANGRDRVEKFGPRRPDSLSLVS